MSAQVPASCTLGPQLPPLYLTTTVDKDGKIDPALVNKTLHSDVLVCTGSSQITLSATSLRLTSPAKALPPGESQTINFIASMSGWGNDDATVTTLDASRVGSLELFEGVPQVQLEPRAASVVIHFSGFAIAAEKDKQGRPASAKLAHGSYAATIKVSLRPFI